MREIILRFEDPAGPGHAEGAVVRGSVELADSDDQAPFRFDGWLQLLGLLEELSTMTEESPEPPRPLPSAGPR
jgi:hypothetical protein